MKKVERKLLIKKRLLVTVAAAIATVVASSAPALGAAGGVGKGPHQCGVGTPGETHHVHICGGQK